MAKNKLAIKASQGGKGAEAEDMPFMPPIHDTRSWYHDLIGQSAQNNVPRLWMSRDDEAEC